MRLHHLALAALACAGCIRAPEIVMVDRATALEEQASGSFGDVEKRLDRAGMLPAPVPFTPDELEALGIQPMPLVDAAHLTFADHVDALLRQHCIGEGQDGLLVDTRRICHGASPAADTAATVERVNRARRRLWAWMHQLRPDATEDALQRNWRTAHATDVICGGWIQAEDGTWGDKKC